MRPGRQFLILSVCALVAPSWARVEHRTPPASRRDAQADTIALRTEIIAVAKTFFTQWSEAWTKSEGDRHSFPATGTTFQELPHVHCHWDDPKFGRLGVRPLVESQATAFSICPTWLEDPRTVSQDERLATIDFALTIDRRAPIRAARARLIELLDSAARAAPTSGFIATQRVRFLLDQGSPDRALDAARACRADAALCASLLGTALAAQSEMGRADSAFRSANSLKQAESRCAWNDVRTLIEKTGREKYAGMSCTQRDTLGAKLLWLADPLFSDIANERRVEHSVRRVLLAFREQLESDERFDWRRKTGNDARAELILRYGWPTRMQWGGVATDREHSGWLADPKQNYSPPNVPYTSYEYSTGRVHTVPLWSAVLDPFHARAIDWSIDTLPVPGGLVPTDSTRWPMEHFAAPFPIVQLTEQQVVVLRRHNDLLLAAAADLDSDRLGRDNGDRIDSITLLTTDRPDSVVRVATVAGTVGSPVVLRGLIPQKPALVAIEFRADGTRPAGRTRLGITPPAPLIALRAGEVAVSDPVILRAPAGNDTLPNDTDAALRRMAGSTRVPARGKIGVFWESYGFQPTDSVEVAVWIERFTPQGIVRRFGIALNIATDLNTPVAISWSEPHPSHGAHVTSGPVPVIGRSVILDASKLPPGQYRLEVAVARRSQQPVRGRSSFVVE